MSINPPPSFFLTQAHQKVEEKVRSVRGENKRDIVNGGGDVIKNVARECFRSNRGSQEGRKRGPE